MIEAHPADSANEIDMCLSAICTGTYALYMFWERDAATTPSTRSAGNKSKLVCSSSWEGVFLLQIIEGVFNVQLTTAVKVMVCVAQHIVFVSRCVPNTCKHYVIPSHDCHWNELVKPHFNAMLAVAIFFLVGTLKLYSIHIQMLWPLWLVYTIAMTKLNFTPFDWYTCSLSFFNKCMYFFLLQHTNP